MNKVSDEQIIKIKEVCNEILNRHYEKLSKLEKPNPNKIGGTFYNRTEIFSSVGNMLDIVKGQHISHGYCSKTYYKDFYGIRIGGAYENINLSDIQKEMHEAIEKILEMTFDGVYVRLNEQEGLTLVYDYGANYSTIGYGFPYH